MKVLLLHSAYLSGTVSGENRVVEDEARLLAEAGHEVSVWAPSPAVGDGMGRARAGVSTLWSQQAVAEVRRRIDRNRPDVIHIHNLFPTLSPAILRVAADASIPSVVTLHNYRQMCISAMFLRDGAVCESCLGKTPWRGVIHRCYRKSLLGSAALASSLTLHRRLGTFDKVALFLAVSEFVREKHLKAGFSPERIIVKPNFVPASKRREGAGDYFLFLGRLSPEKGLETLIEAWKDLKTRLIVVGDGPSEPRLRALASRQVEFTGRVDPAEVPEFLGGARALLVPSNNYEGAPRVVLEAYAAGVPVVASRIGALPEVVQHERSGFIVAPDAPLDWAATVQLLGDDELARRLGQAAYELWQQRYSPARGINDLESAYAAVLGSDRR